MEKNETKMDPKETKKTLLDRISIPVLIGIIIGGIGGFLYYKYIGCKSGTCMITSNIYMTILWGVLIGYLIGDIFTKKKKPVKEASPDSKDSD